MVVQRNMAWGNHHHSTRLIQSHWEPCLECNSILPVDPVEPTVELFFNTQHVKYTCKDTHKRQREQEWKRRKRPWANLYIFSMRWARKKKKKASGRQQPQSAGTIACETTQGHFVLLCQLSHPIQRDEERGGEKKWSSRAQTRWTRLWCALRDSGVTLQEVVYVSLVVSFIKQQKNCRPPPPPKKTWKYDDRWMNSSLALMNYLFQRALPLCSIFN